MPPAQTLAAGTSVTQKYPSLGFTGIQMRYPLNKLFGMIVGRFSSGKSTLFQSNPEAYIINSDLTSTVAEPLRATIWPGVSPSGEPIDADSKPMQLTHQRVLDKLKLLEALSKENKPRPSCVVYDTITTEAALTKAWMVENANSRRQDNKPPITRWRDLHGETAWDELYENILFTCAWLRGLGYGVWLLIHLTDDVIRLNDAETIVKPKLSLPDGFMKRAGPLLEVIGLATKEVEQEVITKKEDVLNDKTGEKLYTKDVTITVPKTRYYVDFDNPKLAGILKPRAGARGRIPLSKEDPWGDFERAYNSSN